MATTTFLSYSYQFFFTIHFIYLFVCCLIYPASKSIMTIRHCFWHADLVSYSSFYIFLIHLFPSQTSSFSPLHNSSPVVSLCYPGASTKKTVIPFYLDQRRTSKLLGCVNLTFLLLSI